MTRSLKYFLPARRSLRSDVASESFVGGLAGDAEGAADVGPAAPVTACYGYCAGQTVTSLLHAGLGRGEHVSGAADGGQVVGVLPIHGVGVQIIQPLLNIGAVCGVSHQGITFAMNVGRAGMEWMSVSSSV